MESDILDTLEQLGYPGPLLEDQDLLRAAGGGLSCAQFVDLCRWLVSRLKPLCDLDQGLTAGPEDLDSLQVEVGALLKELDCPYEDLVSGILKGRVPNPKDHLKLLLFLSSELQAAQVLRTRRDSDQHQEESPARQELLLICGTLDLDLSESRGQDAALVLANVQNKVKVLVQDLPNGSIRNPVLKKSLSPDQWERLRSINRVLGSEYECRRRMLIKRLDVTVQSFGWSERAKVKVDSMAKVYQPRRHSLRPQSGVDVAQLLAAREDLCNVVKTSSGSSRKNTTCAVNKILMGRVPDRGGRPSEIQAPPPEMPPWQKRQEGGGGGWGGRGGGRGGGGWGGGGGGGGGGGWRGGGWNQGGQSGHGGYGNYGGHGGKRGRYQY